MQAHVKLGKKGISITNFKIKQYTKFGSNGDVAYIRKWKYRDNGQ